MPPRRVLARARRLLVDADHRRTPVGHAPILSVRGATRVGARLLSLCGTARAGPLLHFFADAARAAVLFPFSSNR
jgi:hypothetical protein